MGILQPQADPPETKYYAFLSGFPWRLTQPQIIEEITKVSVYSKTNELETTKYAVTIPRDQNDDKSIYVIEEYIPALKLVSGLIDIDRYSNQPAFEEHMGSPAVAGIMKFFESNPGFQAGPPQVYVTQADLLFTRPAIAKAADPLIAFAHMNYKPGKTIEVHEAWRRVCAIMSLSEEGTLAQLVLKDQEDESKLYLIEVFQDENYLHNEHGKSAEFKQQIVKEEALRATAPDAVFLKKVGGYLWK